MMKYDLMESIDFLICFSVLFLSAVTVVGNDHVTGYHFR